MRTCMAQTKNTHARVHHHACAHCNSQKTKRRLNVAREREDMHARNGIYTCIMRQCHMHVRGEYSIYTTQSIYHTTNATMYATCHMHGAPLARWYHGNTHRSPRPREAWQPRNGRASSTCRAVALASSRSATQPRASNRSHLSTQIARILSTARATWLYIYAHACTMHGTRYACYTTTSLRHQTIGEHNIARATLNMHA